MVEFFLLGLFMAIIGLAAMAEPILNLVFEKLGVYDKFGI